MRMFFRAAAVSLFAVSAALAAEQAPTKEAPKAAYPVAVALSFSDGRWVFKQFPSLHYLYTREGDEKNKSNCGDTDGCYSAWPPLVAGEFDKALGEWSVFPRDDGRKQWAYKGQPIYLRFHDVIEDFNQPSIEGFHLLEP